MRVGQHVFERGFPNAGAGLTKGYLVGMVDHNNSRLTDIPKNGVFMSNVSFICNNQSLPNVESDVQTENDALLPIDYCLYVEYSLKLVTSLLESGEAIPVCVFLGNEATGSLTPLVSTTNSGLSGPLSTEHIMLMAAITGADFILMIGESWKIRKNCPLTIEEVRLKYGSIAASPYAVEACSFALETRDGIWLAQPEIKGHSYSSRSIGKVEFQRADAAQWQQMSLLPKRL